MYLANKFLFSFSVSCCYINRDIMCKHDVMAIQHAHCDLVGHDPGARKVGQWV